MLKINKKNYKSENFVSEKEMIKIVKKLQEQGKKVGICTGSFDLLHPGHITHLISAKDACDVLIVAIARNKYSKSKFPNMGRPIFSDTIRAFMISQLKSVDYVFLDDGTIETIPNIKPDVYVKGLDYADLKEPNIIKEKKMIESWGGRMIFTDTEKLSTTKLINYIKLDVSLPQPIFPK